jgi:hypothetical protein
MPWKEVSIRSSRKELAKQGGANIRALCRYFGIRPKTGYKLLKCYAALATRVCWIIPDNPRRRLAAPA